MVDGQYIGDPKQELIVHMVLCKLLSEGFWEAYVQVIYAPVETMLCQE